MERLTYKDGRKWRIRIGDVEYSGNWVDRLAAYEDTGLEPEDIKRVFNEDAILKLAGAVLGVTSDRLRELAQASILKGAIFPGAIVYCFCEDLPCFYPTTGGWYVSEESIGAVGVGCFYVGDPSENTAFDVSDIGKTVFLTREEAEAALKEEEA